MDRVTLSLAMKAMSDPEANAAEIARKLGMTTTLYAYVNGDGPSTAAGSAILAEQDGYDPGLN